MGEERLLKILLSPRISEKGTLIENQYVFEVAHDAIKPEIKWAVESQFGVIVKSIRVCNVKGKAMRFRKIRGRRKNWKKAYVMLMPGSEIDIASSK
ncbi:MAG: 50S ribosomal protein L23 [Coxiella-like endosymbiont]